ncbi:MAG TPA: hypothetical protein DEP38_15270 [Cyanobacteria bacterium UBA9226]|nr:hypothetical protein [Cyanobacteria bacterium UBA9226]
MAKNKEGLTPTQLNHLQKREMADKLFLIEQLIGIAPKFDMSISLDSDSESKGIFELDDISLPFSIEMENGKCWVKTDGNKPIARKFTLDAPKFLIGDLVGYWLLMTE